jgi:hypothetical protein
MKGRKQQTTAVSITASTSALLQFESNGTVKRARNQYQTLG